MDTIDLQADFNRQAKALGASVTYVDTWSACQAVARLPFERPTVRVRPITSPLAYFAALHELGHVAHAHNAVSVRLRNQGDAVATYAAECEAWAWAHAHACVQAPRSVFAQCETWRRSYAPAAAV